MFKGIDVSEHNGVIDWKKVKAAGIQFAMIRAGYGKNNIDKRFVYNITECNKNNISCGIYWFSYAYTMPMAQKEAQYALQAVKPYTLEYPIAYDFEYDSVNYAKKKGVTITKSLASSLVKAFCEEIEKQKYYAINYANPDYLSRYFDESTARTYGLWLAAWNNKSDPPRACQMWQHSSTGKVNGINGNVDMDRAYIDFPSVIRNSGLNGLSKMWYSDAQTWAINNGISDGSQPLQPATRAQVWQMLKRYHEKFYK